MKYGDLYQTVDNRFYTFERANWPAASTPCVVCFEGYLYQPELENLRPTTEAIKLWKQLLSNCPDSQKYLEKQAHWAEFYAACIKNADEEACREIWLRTKKPHEKCNKR